VITKLRKLSWILQDIVLVSTEQWASLRE
jgi:hypothetical protein